MASPIGSFSGIASGIDFQSLIDQIIAVDRKPADDAQTQINLLTTRKTAWSNYKTMMNSVQTAAKALQTGTAFSTLNATVVGTTIAGRPILTATAGSAAQPGTYSIEVTTLATAGNGSTTAQADTAVPILAGGATTATFDLNGTTITIDSTNNSLGGMRDAINAAGAGATAYLMATGTGTTLVVKANATGAAGLNFTETSGTGTLAAIGWAQTAGTDASLKVDGVPITRSSNSIADAIPGLTLTLTGAEVGSTAQVTVARDTTAARTAVQTFIDAYNKIQDFIDAQRPSGAAGATRPPLASEMTLAGDRSAFSRALQATFATNPAASQTLSQAGIRLDRTGRLSLDGAAFDASFATSQTDLRALMADRFGAVASITDRITAFSSGSVDLKNASIDRQIATLNDRITRIDDKLARRRDALTKTYVAMETAIAKLQNIQSSVSGQLAALSQ